MSILEQSLWLLPLLAGLLLACLTAPLGSLVVWRRMAYFGETLAHSALLGVALSLLTGWHWLAGLLLVALGMASLLAWLQQQTKVSQDTLLGICAHGSLALGILAINSQQLRLDPMLLLFGDLLTLNLTDLGVLLIGALLILAGLAWQWRNLLSLCVQPELAEVEGVPIRRVHWWFLLLLALLITLALKMVGVLLITALLVIPPATARRFSQTPGQMVLLAAVVGQLAVGLGLLASWHWDWPTGPAIVAAATALYFGSLALPARG